MKGIVINMLIIVITQHFVIVVGLFFLELKRPLLKKMVIIYSNVITKFSIFSSILKKESLLVLMIYISSSLCCIGIILYLVFKFNLVISLQYLN